MDDCVLPPSSPIGPQAGEKRRRRRARVTSLARRLAREHRKSIVLLRHDEVDVIRRGERMTISFSKSAVTGPLSLVQVRSSAELHCTAHIEDSSTRKD